jgi:hypothetical protein
MSFVGPPGLPQQRTRGRQSCRDDLPEQPEKEVVIMMSTTRPRSWSGRPEQEWTLALALCAFVPHVLALATVRGWLGGGGEGPLSGLAGIYFLGLPVTLGIAIWALVRSIRTLRTFGAAPARERALAVLASVMSLPTLLVSAALTFAFGMYAISGGN